MATLSELRTLISGKLADGNLIDPTSAQIDAQINSTIKFYETDAFWFSEGYVNVSTVAGDPQLYLTSVTDFKQEILPNGLTVVEGQVHYPLQKLSPLEYESIFIDDALGLPRAYTYRNGTIQLWYTPDKVYTVKLFYRKVYSALSSDGDSNDYTNYTPRLIEYKTLADLYRDYRADDERAAIYERVVQTEYNKIKNETYNRTATGYLTTENIVDRNLGVWGNYYG